MATLGERPSAKRWLPLEANPDVMNQVFPFILHACICGSSNPSLFFKRTNFFGFASFVFTFFFLKKKKIIWDKSELSSMHNLSIQLLYWVNCSSFGVLGFQRMRPSAVMFTAWMKSFWKWFQSLFLPCFSFIQLPLRLVSYKLFITYSLGSHFFIQLYLFNFTVISYSYVLLLIYQSEEERLQQDNEKRVSGHIYLYNFFIYL